MADDENLSFPRRMGRFCQYHWQGVASILIPIAFCPLLFLKPVMEFRCAYLVVVMAFYWITEAIPLYLTSMIPIVGMPLMGIMDSSATCLAYFPDSLMLFTGGLIIALAIEYCNLHKRVGLNIILIVGCSPRRLHFSLLFVTTIASMWISNAAATAMMCPVIKAVLEELEGAGMLKMTDDTQEDQETPYPSKSALAYYIGVAYCASVGGCGTLIGTGTNITFKGIFDTRFPQSKDIDFLNFMLYNLPPMLVNAALVYIWLEWLYMGLFRPKSVEAKEIDIGPEGVALTRRVIEQKHDELGPIDAHQIQVSILFFVMMILFVVRKPGFFPGWANVINAVNISSSAVVVLICYLFFALPTNYMFLKYFICRKPENDMVPPGLMSWDFIQKRLPWGLIILLGGGFSLAAGIKASGFAIMVGQALAVLKPLPPALIQFLCIFTAIFTTNFTSNVAMCNILMPVLLEMSIAIEMHPLYLSLPASMGLSMAFHLPVSTPPNAIAAGFANIRTKDLAIAGIGPSLITLITFFVTSQSWAYIIFPNYTEFPQWAREDNSTAS